METIVKISFDGGTMSAPAFLDVWTEEAHYLFQGKQAKKAFAKYKVGDEIDPDNP